MCYCTDIGNSYYRFDNYLLLKWQNDIIIFISLWGKYYHYDKYSEETNIYIYIEQIVDF